MVVRMSQPDFIQITDNAVSREDCAAIVQRMRDSQQLHPGRIGGGVFPELKHSRDLRISGVAEWAAVENRLQQAVFEGVLTYLRHYPQALISPLMLQVTTADGSPHRLVAEDIAQMSDQALGDLARTCLRPGAINLQWYTADQGGYPYWHCELYPRDASADTLHRHLLWTLYLNDEFEQGETEFLFQQRKARPRTGSLLIAPTAFTHTHRGNRPVGGDKFIATSWILFQSASALYGGDS
jgi:hypothetical protein